MPGNPIYRMCTSDISVGNTVTYLTIKAQAVKKPTDVTVHIGYAPFKTG
jgi:hypothetical protein